MRFNPHMEYLFIQDEITKLYERIGELQRENEQLQQSRNNIVVSAGKRIKELEEDLRYLKENPIQGE